MRVVPVTYQTLSSIVSTNGKVEPVDFFQGPHAPFAGPIKQIFVEVGQHVKAGQLLVRMDDADARGRLASAEAGEANSALICARLASRRQYRGACAAGYRSAIRRRSTSSVRRRISPPRRCCCKKGPPSQAEVDAAQQRLDTANLTLSD